MPPRKPKPKPPLMWPVLVTVMEDRLYAAGKIREDVTSDIRGLTASALSNLAAGKTMAPRQGVDAVVDAYAAAIGCDVDDLWAAAYERLQEIRPQADEWLRDWREDHRKETRQIAARVRWERERATS